jgi:hypothetical protein
MEDISIVREIFRMSKSGRARSPQEESGEAEDEPEEPGDTPASFISHFPLAIIRKPASRDKVMRH